MLSKLEYLKELVKESMSCLDCEAELSTIDHAKNILDVYDNLSVMAKVVNKLIDTIKEEK